MKYSEKLEESVSLGCSTELRKSSCLIWYSTAQEHLCHVPAHFSCSLQHYFSLVSEYMLGMLSQESRAEMLAFRQGNAELFLHCIC